MPQRRVSNQYRVIVKGTPNPSPITRAMMMGAPKDAERITCPFCDKTVALRSDGSIRAHRVGTSRANSWPCVTGATR
jgi:hypothetical protein